MRKARKTEAAAPKAIGPEVVMPQESRPEVDRAFVLVHEMSAAEAAMFKVFLQGMEYQRTLFAAGAARLGS